MTFQLSAPGRGNTGLFFPIIGTAESLFCCCYRFLLSVKQKDAESNRGAPGESGDPEYLPPLLL